MKTVSPQLEALLLAQKDFWIADCLKISCLGGTYTFWATNAETGVYLPENGGMHFYPKALFFERTVVSQVKGLEVGEMSLTLYVNSTLGAMGQSPALPIPVTQACINGVFDGAEVTLWRAFASGPPEPADLLPGPDSNFAHVLFYHVTGGVEHFSGYMSDVVSGHTQIECKVVSKLSRLDVKFPRNIFTPGCSWTLYSPGCGVQKFSFAIGGRISSLNDSVLHVTAFTGGATFDKPENYYALGYVEFTSGSNTGLRVSIKESSGGHLSLVRPTPFPVALGDRVVVFPGCDKTYETCRDKFNNLPNWRGFPYLPGPSALIGAPQRATDPGEDSVPPMVTINHVPPEDIGGSFFEEIDLG